LLFALAITIAVALALCLPFGLALRISFARLLLALCFARGVTGRLTRRL
jgi:hypothetical protein